MKKMIACMLILALSLSGLAFAAEKPLSIVCTSFPCYDFARAVVGDDAGIRLLIKPGAEVHSYEPTPADIMAIAACDLFVYVGGESDAWVVDILESFGDDAPRTLRFFDCVEGIEAEHAHEDAHHEEMEYDEHIWTSQANACAMVSAMSDALCAIDPDYADAYKQNALSYTMEIGLINTEIKEIVETATRKEMLFADRFPFLYFAQEYGLDYTSAFPNCSAESEPSAKTIMELIQKICVEQIPAVYTLELSNGKTAKAIAEETGVKVLTFHSIQNVSEEDFSAGETYVSLMQRNIAALQEGLN